MTFADNHNLETAVTIPMKQNTTSSMATVPESQNGETRYEGCAISEISEKHNPPGFRRTYYKQRHPDPLVTLEIF